MRYRVYATGSICYDKTGITYPYPVMLNLVELLRNAGAINIFWAQLRSNQPFELFFNHNVAGAEEIAAAVYDLGLLIKPYNHRI